MQLTHQEFIRRFCNAYFAQRFCKNTSLRIFEQHLKQQKLGVLKSKLQIQPAVKTAQTTKIRKCKCCKTGNLHTILIFDKRGPPEGYLGDSQNSSSYKKKILWVKILMPKSEGKHIKNQ